MKSAIRRLYFRNKLVRAVINCGFWLFRPQNRLAIGHLIPMQEEEACGPVQRAEALFLSGIIHVTQPKTVVEFGFQRGRSAFNFLSALPRDSHLYSFDIRESARQIAGERLSHFKNFHFLKKSQDLFSPADVDNRTLDFAFIDGAHNLEINKRTFIAILPSLSENAIVAIHDTGTWLKEFFTPIHAEIAATKPERWLNSSEFQHQVDEREFVNWIVTNHPEFSALHFHSKNCLRHGITLLQKSRALETVRTNTPLP
jgi:hypothetical protein